MASFVVTPGGVQCDIRWTVSGVACINVFGGRTTGTGSYNQASADGLRDIITAAYNGSGLSALQPPNVAILAVGLRDVSAANRARFESALTPPVGGTSLSQALPHSVAAVATFRTAMAGKSFRGRSYMPGLDEAQNSNDTQIEAAVKTAVEAFWTSIRNNVPTLGFQQSILSPALPQRPSSVPGEPDLPAKSSTNEPVVAVIVRNLTWGSQRRRNHRA